MFVQKMPEMRTLIIKNINICVGGPPDLPFLLYKTLYELGWRNRDESGATEALRKED